MEQYNIFVGLEKYINGNDLTLFVPFVANVAYNIIMYACLAMFVYKVVTSIYLYNTRAVHEIQKNQMVHEIFEPVAGLIMLVVGHIILRIVMLEMFGINITIQFWNLASMLT